MRRRLAEQLSVERSVPDQLRDADPPEVAARPAVGRVVPSRASTSVARLTYVVWYGCIVTWSMVGSTSASPGDQRCDSSAGQPWPVEPPRHPVRGQHGERRDREEQLPQAVVEVGAEHDRDDGQGERLDADQREPRREHPLAGWCRSRSDDRDDRPGQREHQQEGRHLLGEVAGHVQAVRLLTGEEAGGRLAGAGRPRAAGVRRGSGSSPPGRPPRRRRPPAARRG